MTGLPPASQAVVRSVFGDRFDSVEYRNIPEEVAVALTYNRHAYATMMASPLDLEDFAVGFSLSERVIGKAGEILELEVVAVDGGIELRMTITGDRFAAFASRRRFMAGPTGCGLCGIEVIAEATRAPPVVTADITLSPNDVLGMTAALRSRQPLNHLTHAVHAAGYWQPETGLGLVREDVGRHNALDKLAGAVVRTGLPTAGVVILTSRVSVEMVQKTAMLGVPVIVAVSAPTALAIRTAAAANITLVGVARDDGFEAFTRADRIAGATGVDGSSLSMEHRAP